MACFFDTSHLVIAVDVATSTYYGQVLSLHLFINEFLEAFPFVGVDSIIEHANGAEFETLARGAHPMLQHRKFS